jgi:hypothetical protein
MMQTILQCAAENSSLSDAGGSAGMSDAGGSAGISLSDAGGSAGIESALVAALSSVRPWTPASLQSMMRLAELLVHIPSARSPLLHLLRSTVWEDVCRMLLPLAGLGWGRGLLEVAAGALGRAELGRCR